MKLKLLLFMLLCVFTTSAAQHKINKGWSFYQEDGKWGVLYKGEPCLLPRFDGVSGTIENGRFVYKEKNKYGISTVWKKVTEPFCDSLIWIHNRHYPESSRVFAIYKKDGKWGICSTDGTTILAPAYQKIDKNFYDFRVFRVYPSKYEKKPLLRNIYYFLVNDGTSNKMIDVLGKTIISDIGNFEDFICADGKGNKAIIKTAKKKEWSRKDKDETDKLKAIDAKVSSANMVTSLYGDYQIWDNDYYDYAERYENMKKPRMLYFGERTKAFGDTTVIDGFESIVNNYGFISTPLTYDSPYFKLQNNPTDVQSLLFILEMEEIQKGKYFRTKDQTIFFNEDDIRNGVIKEDMIRMGKRLEDYQSLMKLAKQINDTVSFKTVNSEYKKLHSLLQDFEFYYDKNVKRIDFNDRMDRLANTATSVLNSIANTIGGNSSTTLSYNTTSNNSSTSNASANTKGNQMSMSDQVNYNSLRNTYNKWASDLMQMKNANGKYQNGFKASDKKHAQDEMKRIRKSAMQKWSKEIPYNSIEDW